MKRFILSIILVLISCHLSHFGCKDDDSPSPTNPPRTCFGEWEEYSSNPVIDYEHTLDNIIWNDPSVIKEGSTYRMWLSGGKGYGINYVKIYEAESTDGLAWTIDSTVLLESNSDITVTYSGTVPADVAGTYKLLDEDANSRIFKHETENYYIYYHPTDLTYYMTDSDDEDVYTGGTYYWRCKLKEDGGGSNGRRSPDGEYELLVGTADGVPIAQTEWDSEKIETPMVVKVGSTYHMYYSGFRIGDPGGAYQTGHATSDDGITWTKDPGNPVLSYQMDDPAKWGFYQAAEPGAVYDLATDTIYLYYVSSKLRTGWAGDSSLNSMQGICLSTSPGNDGSNFTHYDPDSDGARNAVLVQSANYLPEDTYRGYSTPYPMIDSDGVFHLFYDVVSHPDFDPADWRQVALAHSTSTDGKNFTETEHDIFTYENGDWPEHEVRAPCVIQEGDIFKMWFAGTGDASLFLQPGFSVGIGYATFGMNCE